MTSSAPEPSVTSEADATAERERRRRAAERLGDLLPSTTSDETDEGWGERERGRTSRDDELLRDVPPHHG